jgi:hypothetical protein
MGQKKRLPQAARTESRIAFASAYKYRLFIKTDYLGQTLGLFLLAII